VVSSCSIGSTTTRSPRGLREIVIVLTSCKWINGFVFYCGK
jgi:hypothetical protein